MGNICANTNGLRSDFEGASSHLIEVDPYLRSTKYNTTKPNPVKASEFMFDGRGKTGVDLHWHTQQEFRDIYSDQKDEVTSWQGSNEGNASIKKHRNINSRKRKSDPDNDKKGRRRKKFKKSIKTQSRLSHVIYIMLDD